MRLLIALDGLWNGGAERQMAQLTSSLPKSWTPHVVSLEDGPYRAVFEGLGIDVQVIQRRFRFDAASALKMWRKASAIAPDIVQSVGWMSSAAMIPFCRAHRTPLVNATIRQGRLPGRRALLSKLCLSLSDAIVANSRAGLVAYRVPESAGHVVYNGFDPSRLAGAPSGNAAADSAKTVVIMAARMVPAKDWRSFLAVARAFSDEAAGWTFVAAGAGPERERLLAEAEDLVRSGLVRFAEGGLEVLPLVAGAHIGLLLTEARRAEGCSNSVMEYMACGLPVVCTESGGNPELVEDGVTGLLVAPGEPGEAVEALRTLRDEPARAREMGREGKRRLETRFTTERMVRDFVSIYESLLRDREVTRT